MYDFSITIWEEDALMYTHHRVLIAGAVREDTLFAMEGHHLLFNVSVRRDVSLGAQAQERHDSAASDTSGQRGEGGGGGGAAWA